MDKPTPCFLFPSGTLCAAPPSRFEPPPPPFPPPFPSSLTPPSPPHPSFLVTNSRKRESTDAAPFPTPTPFFVRSAPFAKSSSVTTSRSSRAANKQASLTTFASSAPVNPGVNLATVSTVKSSDVSVATPRKCTRIIWHLPLKSGGPTKTRRVNRPGRSNAGSRASARLVAASTNTPPGLLNPSISTSIWFKVWSRSSFNPAPRRAPLEFCQKSVSLS